MNRFAACHALIAWELSNSLQALCSAQLLFARSLLALPEMGTGLCEAGRPGRRKHSWDRAASSSQTSTAPAQHTATGYSHVLLSIERSHFSRKQSKHFQVHCTCEWFGTDLSSDTPCHSTYFRTEFWIYTEQNFQQWYTASFHARTHKDQTKPPATLVCLQRKYHLHVRPLTQHNWLSKPVLKPHVCSSCNDLEKESSGPKVTTVNSTAQYPLLPTKSALNQVNSEMGWQTFTLQGFFFFIYIRKQSLLTEILLKSLKEP